MAGESQTTPILYTCAGSRGLRCTWAAQEAGVELDLRMLPFPPRHKAPEYLETNPLGTIPMLVDGDTQMTESCAIAHYLAIKGGAHHLFVAPGEADYGEYLDYTYHADATITFPQTVYMRFALFEKVTSRPLSSACFSLISRPHEPHTLLARREVTSSESPIALPTSRIAMRGR